MMQHPSSSLESSASPVMPHCTAIASGAAKQLTRLIHAAWQRVPFYSKHWRTLAARLRMTVNTFLQNVVRARRHLAECLGSKGIDVPEVGT